MSIKSFVAAMSLKVKIIIACTVLAVAGAITAAVLINAEKTDTYRVLKVFELTGSAVVTRQGSGDIDAYVGMNLESGDMLTVCEDSVLRISMDGDKYVLLDAGTVLELVAEGSSADSRTSISLKEGTILNELTTSLSANSSYEVATPKATMAVRGTSFMVSVEPNEDGSYIIKTDTLHGKVEVMLLDAEGKPTGESAMVSEDKCVVIRTEPDPGSGNPAELDGRSFFVYEIEQGVYVEVPEGEDPVKNIVYEYISGIIKEYALRSNDDRTMELDEYIIRKLRGDSDEVFAAETTSAVISEEAETENEAVTTLEEVAAEESEPITTTVPTTAYEIEETTVTTTPPITEITSEETAVPTMETTTFVSTEETIVTTTISETEAAAEEAAVTTTVPDTAADTEEAAVTTTVPDTAADTEEAVITTTVPGTTAVTVKTTVPTAGRPNNGGVQTTYIVTAPTWMDTNKAETVTTTVPTTVTTEEETTVPTTVTTEEETTVPTTVTTEEETTVPTTVSETEPETTTTAEEIKTFKVTFEIDGEIVYSEDVNEGDTVSAIPNLTEKKGRTGTWMFNGAEFTADMIISDNITVVAEYDYINYTIRYIFGNDNTTVLDIYENQHYGDPIPEANLSKVYEVEGDSNKYYLFNWEQPTGTIEGDKDYYVNYELNDDVRELKITSSNGEYIHTLVKVGQEITLPDADAVEEWDGYQFIGWGLITSGGYSDPAYKEGAPSEADSTYIEYADNADAYRYSPGSTIKLTDDMSLDPPSKNFKIIAVYRQISNIQSTHRVTIKNEDGTSLFEGNADDGVYLSGVLAGLVPEIEGKNIVYKYGYTDIDPNSFQVFTNIDITVRYESVEATE